MPTTNLLKKAAPFFLLLFILAACNSNDKTKSGKKEPGSTTVKPINSAEELKRLENFDSTDFVFTLESRIPANKNVIYSPTLLYAWEQVEKELESPVKTDKENSEEFKTLLASESFKKSLKEHEYSYEVNVTPGNEYINIKAWFDKTLRFASKFQQLNNEVYFNGKLVKGFGLNRVPSQDTISTYEILYYKDDDHFVLKLVPGDNQHEIMLAKGLEEAVNLEDALKQINSLIATGKKEKPDEMHAWKYRLREKDMFAVPVIGFNIETNYKKLEDQHFFCENKSGYTIMTASQRNAFMLDEEGSTIESEAEIAAVVDSVVAMPVVKTYPKNLICNKTFYIVVKRADAGNPYFMMKVKNTELLRRKK